jgi:hypothetical protein
MSRLWCCRKGLSLCAGDFQNLVGGRWREGDGNVGAVLSRQGEQFDDCRRIVAKEQALALQKGTFSVCAGKISDFIFLFLTFLPLHAAWLPLPLDLG